VDELPKYRALVEDLRHTIESLPVGHAVPSERALAASSGVSRMTARRALDELERAGLLRREVGRGSFVSRPAVSVPLRLTSFSEDIRSRGMTPSSRVLAAREEPAGAELAQVFGISPADPVARIDRVRLADGRPIAIERAALNAAITPGIHRRDLAAVSLYDVLERDFGVRFDAGEQRIRAGLASAQDAELLGVDAGSAVLEFVRVSIAAGTVVERTVSTYPGGRFELAASILPATAPGSAGRSALRERG